MWNFNLMDSNAFYIMKSLEVGDFRAEIEILHFLQLGYIRVNLLPYAQLTLAICYRMRSIH